MFATFTLHLSADMLWCSHVLDHVSVEDTATTFRNTVFVMLMVYKFRIIVTYFITVRCT